MTASETFRNLAPRKQQRILREALGEFSRNGYAKGSLNSLVKRLGISKGSIYQYFGDKAGLFSEVVRFSSQNIQNRINDALRQTKGEDVFERLAKLTMTGLKLQNETAGHVNVYLRIVFEENIPDLEELLQDLQLYFHKILLEILSQGRRDGQIAEDIDLELASLAAMAVVERFLVARSVRFKDLNTGIHQASIDELGRLVTRAMTVLRRGMGVNDRPSRRQPPPPVKANVYASSDREDLGLHVKRHGDYPPGGASPTFHHLAPAKRERIMDEAINMFAERSYGKASLNTLVSRIGISKGSIFKYFHHKANLFFAVFDFVLNKTVGPMRRLLKDSRGQDLFTRLYLSVLAGFDLYRHKPRYFNLYLRIIHDTDLPMRDLMLKTLTSFSCKYMANLFNDARAAGEIPDDLDLDMAALVAMAVVERMLVGHGVEYKDLGIGLYQAAPQEAERISFGVIDCLRRGLGPRR